MKYFIFLFCCFLITCKVKGKYITNRLIGNEVQQSNDLHKSVAIFFNSQSKNICSGSLIHAQWILTSESCAKRIYNEERRVMIGANGTINFDKAYHIKNVHLYSNFIWDYDYDTTTVNARNVMITSNYNYYYDIALVELITPVDSTYRILSILHEEVPKGTKAFALGYGNNGQENRNAILRQRRVSILDNLICNSYQLVTTYYSMLCSYEARACEGDQGGPLIQEGTNKLIGFISISDDQAAMCGGNEILPITTYLSLMRYNIWIRLITGIQYLK